LSDKILPSMSRAEYVPGKPYDLGVRDSCDNQQQNGLQAAYSSLIFKIDLRNSGCVLLIMAQLKCGLAVSPNTLLCDLSHFPTGQTIETLVISRAY
ncbi:unnamed protein product, partial [Ceratitis capitata]